MRIGSWGLAGAILLAGSAGAVALEPGDAFECTVLKYAFESMTLTSDEANERRQLARTFTIVAGDGVLRLVARLPNADPVTETYQVVSGSDALRTHGIVPGMTSISSLSISNEATDGYDGAHSAILAGIGTGGGTLHLLRCEKL